jgi:hypothetical protein
MDILVDQWWRIDRALTLEDTYQSGKVAYLDSIRNGAFSAHHRDQKLHNKGRSESLTRPLH